MYIYTQNNMKRRLNGMDVWLYTPVKQQPEKL